MVGLVDVICIVYLDDILIYSRNTIEHKQHMHFVFECLCNWDLYANLEKCEFYTSSVTFLGFVVSSDGIAMELARVEAIAQWLLLRSVCNI